MSHRTTLTPQAELALAGRTVRHARDVLGFLHAYPSAGTRASRIRVGRAHRWLLRFGLAEQGRALARIEAASFPPHHSLWLCIHGGEGRWDDHDSGHNGHYGGMQMHWDWGYGIHGDAGYYSQAEQEWAAERGYRASGYSSGFLWQQWAADAHCFA